jgi:hypothetical protein
VDAQVVAIVTVLGLLGSTAVYQISQKLGCDDPFAIELVFWWMATDAVLGSRLRNWNLCFASDLVKAHQQIVVSGLLWLGAILLLLTVALSLRTPDGSYKLLNDMVGRGLAFRAIRFNLARMIASWYTSMHLVLFLG